MNVKHPALQRIATSARALRSVLSEPPPSDGVAVTGLAATEAAARGPRFLYHLVREREALLEKRRADARPHLVARLNLSLARPQSPIARALRSASCLDVRHLEHGAVERDREELVSRLASVPLADILDLYQYFRFFGDFRTAQFFRSQLLLAYLRVQETSRYLLPSAVAAAIESGKAQHVLDMARTRPVRDADRDVVRYGLTLARALTGNASEAAAEFELGFQRGDKAFCDAVRGKAIAVVGPSPPTQDLSAQIDEFDFIVRTNFHDGVDPRCGSRTDVSYYNGRRVTTRGADIVAASTRLKWAIMARGSDEPLRRLLPTHPEIRAAWDCSGLFLHASPLAIPIIVADLVRFSPARIQLYCVDFYCSRDAYQDGYHREVVGADSLSHSIRVHDPFSSFRFVQCLHAHGLCSGDEWAGKLLSLRPEEYAERIQQIYGDHFVSNENPRLSAPMKAQGTR